MVGLPYDCLANPLGAVRLTFDKAVASGSDPSTFDGRDWGATELFRQFLFDDGGLSQVPMLNPSTIRWIQPHTLVRFRGMIQDMLGNEFYVGAYKDGEAWRTNKFADVSQFPMSDSPDMRVWERRLLYCVPVPGQNPWTEPSSEVVMDSLKKSNYYTDLQREKRQREDDPIVNDVDMEANDESHASPPSTKKMREDGIASTSTDSGETLNKAICNTTNMGAEFERSFPCLVKIYDSPESDLKLNDIFEFIGVLTFDTDLSKEKEDNNNVESSLCEDVLVELPPSKVPRLHCFVYQKLNVQDFLSNFPRTEIKSHVVKGIRETLLGHLTSVLGNDRVAAEFMLLHLLSQVHARVDTIAVGKLSLNLTCFSNETASVFRHRLCLAIKNLLPFSQCIPLTVDYLNTALFAPKKDYQTNRLVTGALQFADGTHLTVDETQLQSGTLNSTGVENTRLLKNLLDVQKVEYDFTYYKMEMPTDAQLLILSEAKSNILPADIVLPFRPTSVTSYEEVETDVLGGWRWYLGTMKSLSHTIAPEMQKVLEDDLVAARQADRSLGSQEFSRLLTMGRLISLSFGETTLSIEHWQMVKELERLRKERLNGRM
nr:mini-chromosome maintenance complex-binding protein [Ipomoea batatas]GMC96630.1 mini-chromosome maintenance complex-binding protein [Ipomoea batatas]